jgi:hypothetical protein
MENTKLSELRSAYETDVVEGRYLAAEHVCWRALAICGYRGPRQKFSLWLRPARLKTAAGGWEAPLWQWACLLADTYYELGRYEAAEPVYARLALACMTANLTGEGQRVHPLLPDLLRKLAGAEAFVGKERRAGQHWNLAKSLSGRRRYITSLKQAETNFVLGLTDRRMATNLTDRRDAGTSPFSALKSLGQRRRFRRSR